MNINLIRQLELRDQPVRCGRCGHPLVSHPTIETNYRPCECLEDGCGCECFVYGRMFLDEAMEEMGS